MADQNSEMLNKRIEEALGNLETLKGDERAQAVKELDTLYKLRIDETKNEVEARQKTSEHQDQMFQAQADLHEKRIALIVNTAVDVAKFVSQVGMYGILIVGGLKFEENGTIGSQFVKDTIRSCTKFLKK